MDLETQYKIKSDPRLQRFIRENSYWYKYLNRDPYLFKDFYNDMLDKYKLTRKDKLNKVLDNINMIQSFLDVLKYLSSGKI